MAISGLQVINVGLPNQAIGSDSLYTAFNKAATNFNTLFTDSSPYNTFIGATGISVATDTVNKTIAIENTGVTGIIAGTNIVVNRNNGDVTISSTGGGGGSGGTVTSVGVTSGTLTVSNSPVVSSGDIFVNLATVPVTPGTYAYPLMTVDSYGRVTSISSGTSLGTVTSVAVTAGAGIQVSGGPVTNAGTINITNSGVRSLRAGTGISLTGTTGDITISAPPLSGTVSSVGLSSTTLNVSGSPITTVGTMNVDLPANVAVTGQLRLSGSQALTNGATVDLNVTATYFTTTTTSAASLGAGTTGQIKTFMMNGYGGDMVIAVINPGWKLPAGGLGTMTYTSIGQACTLQYINGKWFCVGNNGVTFG
jgi:hypothetical protein